MLTGFLNKLNVCLIFSDVGSTSSADKVGEIVTQTKASGNILPPSADAYIPTETIQETKTTENTQNSSQTAAAGSEAATHSEYLENQNFYTASKTQGYSYPTEYSGGSYQTNSEMRTEANYVSINFVPKKCNRLFQHSRIVR